MTTTPRNVADIMNADDPYAEPFDNDLDKLILDAARHDPIYHGINTPEELPWQLDLYRERLAFLVDELGFRLDDRTRALRERVTDKAALRYTGPRAVLTVRIVGDELAIEPALRLRGPSAPRRPVPVWMIRCAATGEPPYDDAEALRLGRDCARRASIERLCAFLRGPARPCLLGDPHLLHQGRRYQLKRERWDFIHTELWADHTQTARLQSAVARAAARRGPDVPVPAVPRFRFRECPKCRYSMEGIPAFTCPECGTDVRRVRIKEHKQRVESKPMVWWLNALAMWLMATLFANYPLLESAFRPSDLPLYALADLGLLGTLSMILFIDTRRTLIRRWSPAKRARLLAAAVLAGALGLATSALALFHIPP